MTCYSCLHYDVCLLHEDDFISIAMQNGFCGKYKDKSNFIELGVTVYEVIPIYRSEREFSMCEEVHSDLVVDFYVQKTKLTLANVSDIGKDVFYTIEEAKRALKKRKQGE